nr:hypothetical protein [Tanacetum cinerariifolium]
MNKSWMRTSRTKKQYTDGVEVFIKYVVHNLQKMRNIDPRDFDMDFGLEIPTYGPATVEMVNATKESFDEDDLSKFQKQLLDAEKPLYKGCLDFTKFSVIVQLLNFKGKHGASDMFFIELLGLLKNMLPAGNEMVKKTYQAKNLMRMIGSGYKKIHVCSNNCTLYWKDNKELTVCPTCGISRWKVYNKTQKVYKNIPTKLMWYFPIIPRLQRLFKLESISKDLKWHATRRITDGVLHHLADSQAWRTIDEKFPEIAKDQRNIRLGISPDEVDVNSGTRHHSVWGKENEQTIRPRKTKKIREAKLRYWRHNSIPHCIDFMHVEKNVCESLVGTLLNVHGKTKDGMNARLDLAELGIKLELFARQEEDKTTLHPSGYTLTYAEKDIFYEMLSNIRVPQGYCLKFSSLVSLKDRKLIGLKLHDYHMLMQEFLPIAIRSIMHPPTRYDIIRNRPEGCIAEETITEETIEFFSEYHKNMKTISIPPDKHVTNENEDEKPLSTGKSSKVSGEVFQKAHLYVIHNTDEIVPYIEQQKNILKTKNSVKYEAYNINGYTFRTKSNDGVVYQNSGVSVDAVDLHISKEVTTTRKAFYYGVLQKIWIDAVQVRVTVVQVKIVLLMIFKENIPSEPDELIFSIPPTSPHMFFNRLEELPPRTTNPPPPQPMFNSIKRLAKHPLPKVMEPSLPPLPAQLPPSHLICTNNAFPTLTHKMFCDHCQRAQVLVNDLRDEMRNRCEPVNSKGRLHWKTLAGFLCEMEPPRTGEDTSQPPSPPIASAEAPQMVSSIKLLILKKGMSTKDANQKFLRSLPLAWSNISLIMSNKPGIDNLDTNNLYKNFKVSEADIKGSSGSSSNSQNVAFVFKESTSSNNELRATYSISTATCHSSQAQEKIDQDDLEEMDLKTGRKLRGVTKLKFNGKEPVGLDKTKVECFNCHRRGHFARDCKTAGNLGNRSRDAGNARYKGRDNGKRPAREEDEKALVVQDGLGTYDWSYQVEEEATDFDIMAFTLNPSSSLSLNFEHEKLRKANLEIVGYQYGLELIEGQSRVHQQNEVIYEEKIGVLEYDVKDKKEEVTKTVFDNFLSDKENSLANDRFKKGKGYHAVPPPLTGNYMPPKSDLSFAGLDDSIYKFKISETVTSLTKDKKDALKTSTAFVEKTYEVKTISAVKGNGVTAVKTSAGCVWRPRVNETDQISKDNRWICTHGHPQQALKNKGIVNSGCSRHMTGSKAYLADYQEINDGGFVAFGSSRGLDGCFSWPLRMKSKVLKPFITAIENKINKKVKVIRCDNGTKFKNKDLDELCGMKMIKREYSNARTSQQNRVAERKNMTLIEAARTILADSLLPITFWAEAVNTACYVLNRALVTKSNNKTPYELLNGRIPRLDFMRLFGYPVIILNTLDPLGKFEGKADEGFLVGCSVTSKAFRVFNTKTKKVEKNLYVRFLENKLNVAGTIPNWLFDIDSLTNSMNYIPVFAGNQTDKNAGPQDTNGNAGTQDNVDTGKEVSDQHYIVLPLWSSISSTFKSSHDKAANDKPKDGTGSKTIKKPVNKEDQAYIDELDRTMSQEKEAKTFSAGGPSSPHPDAFIPTNTLLHVDQNDSQIPDLEDTVELRKADFNNMESSTVVSPIPTHRVHIDHPKDQILGDPKSAVQTRRMAKKSSRAHAFMEPKKVAQALDDESWVK